MEYSDDENDESLVKINTVDVNANYLIEHFISSTKSFFATNFLHRTDNCVAESPEACKLSMNLRSRCSGDCVMQGLPHAHTHKNKSPVPATQDRRSSSRASSSKDINDNLTCKQSKDQAPQQEQSLNDSTYSSNVSTSSRLSLSSFESDSSEVSQRYLDYLNSSQEERDRNKTDYTYAHSYSYSRFVAERERFNWPVPNMSRQGIHNTNRVSASETAGSHKTKRHTLTTQKQSSTRMIKSDMKTDFNPTTSSTPTRSRRKNQQFDGFSEDDEELVAATSLMKLHSSGSSPDNSNFMSEDATSTLLRSNAAEMSEDEEEIIRKRRTVKNTLITSVRNYFTGMKKDQSNENDDNVLGHHSSLRHTNIRPNGNKYAHNNGGPRHSSHQSINWMPALLYLLISVLSLFSLYYLNAFGIFGSMMSLVPSLSVSRLGWLPILPSSDSGRPLTSPVLYKSSDSSSFDLREEIMELREIINAQQVQLSKQQKASSANINNDHHSQINELVAKIKELELGMVSCCHKNSSVFIEEKVRLLLEGKWLDEIKKSYDEQLKAEVNKIQLHLIDYFDEHAKQQREPSAPGTLVANSSNIEQLIRQALSKYDADKTGEADYALESTGAYILSTRCSESYQIYSGSYQIFGITVWRSSNSPREVIQPQVVPGECWCFRGASGRVAIHLSTRIVPTAFAYEHIPRVLSREGNIHSAPASFKVYGLKTENDLEPELLGSYTYLTEGEPLQRFEVSNPQVAAKGWSMVEMVVDGNHGHPDYTCLYRFRVHGVPATTSVP